MNQLVCNYAPVRFLPYREIGEFVNVGVAVHCPQRDFFGFRLVPLKRIGRVRGFFPELDVKIFKAGLAGVARELTRVRTNHHARPITDEIPSAIARERVLRFQEIIRRRDGLFHFGDAGTLMAETPDEALDHLFGRFVERQYAQKMDYAVLAKLRPGEKSAFSRILDSIPAEETDEEFAAAVDALS
jgi:hypothetical protein